MVKGIHSNREPKRMDIVVADLMTEETKTRVIFFFAGIWAYSSVLEKSLNQGQVQTPRRVQWAE